MAPVQGGPSSLGVSVSDLSVGTTGCTFSGKGRNWRVTLGLVCRLPLAACQLPWRLRLGVGFLRVPGEHGGDWFPPSNDPLGWLCALGPTPGSLAHFCVFSEP